jgi:hypothetical protein
MAIGGAAILLLGGVIARVARALARIGWRRTSAQLPPVVYLRSFEDDRVSLPSVLSARRPFVEMFTLRGREPFEECLAWELAAHGPVIAIGRPGQSRASLGAAREHLDTDQWQQVISAQLAIARLIVITVGATPGLAWEVQHIVRSGYLDKAVFVVAPVAEPERRRRWHFILETLRQEGVSVLARSDLPDSAIIVVVAGNGATVVVGADRRDESTYRAAIDVAAGARTIPDSTRPATSEDSAGDFAR